MIPQVPTTDHPFQLALPLVSSVAAQSFSSEETTALRLPIAATLVILVHLPTAVNATQVGGGHTALPTQISEGKRLAIHAVSTVERPRIDGKLDDRVWHSGNPSTGFVQSEPDEGARATERTEVWVAFDADNLYVAAHLYDSDPNGVVIKDIRRDFRRDNQDTFEVILDTFGDRRNGYIFATNAAGARGDEQVTNEGRETNTSWDAPWSVKTERTSDGWTLEMSIPFAALRTGRGDVTTWGINFSRRIRRKNELVFWAPIPRAYALTRLSLAGNLHDLGTVKRGLDLRVTPYMLGRTVRETGGATFAEDMEGGVDIKYGITVGLTLDAAVNPDFAQVESDVQQVNLTQFSQFFPEKREFFLENSGLFYIGDTPRNTRISTAPRGDEDLLVFFSRRIGLSPDGRPIPLDGGVRLTGQEGGFLIGALAARTNELDSIPGNDFGVFRLRRNVFANSDVGALFMARSAVDDRGDHNYIYGGDANIRLPGRVDWSSFFINSDTPGLSGSTYAFQTSLNREANFVHVKFSHLSIGDNFNDELGFVRRTGVRKWHADIGIRPRPTSLRRLGVREMHPHIVWNYLTDLSGTMIAKRFHSGYTFFFNNGGFGEFSVNPRTETLTSELTVHPDAQPVPPGRHDWVEYMLRGFTDQSRLLSLEFTGILGGLWTGTQRTIRLTANVRPSHHLFASVGVSRTAGDLGVPGGDFVREIWTFRGNYSFTTDMFIDALAQYLADRDLLNLNIRFNLIHRPLSNVYLVYNEQRFTTDNGVAPGRSVILKVTYMFGL